MITVKYKTNIHCNSCIKSITPVLNNLDNVDFWKVDLEHPDKILEVTLDDHKKEDILNAVSNAGFKITEM
ncbi:heavy-metal-associated domain-containing protein [Polaribacter sargassicola]|uniref:heavy-metal-associated domain-containing protein n=1 Tax=Polaribacter sargassicola TaxID=2836891 RepID=UPI001F2641FE|nr:heavy-metal-associated domain-containing protein [Polaribacter sp. DS7-9]MCG1036138.1 heavy-metal-associated domain-containing protein [Polaribacter sp. DS7-9]